MTYLRNPRHPELWESDGAAPFGKYRANDGTLHDSAREADAHDCLQTYRKKPYSKPVLRKYGNIRDMTETSTSGMHSDAHGHRRSLHKTA